MDYGHDFFEMQIENGTWYGYRVSISDADAHSKEKLMTVARNTKGQLCTVQPALLKPRTMAGLIRVKPGTREDVGVTGNNGTTYYGSLEDLLTCYEADVLRVQAWHDDIPWLAKWVGRFSPVNLDTVGRWFQVPFQLEQIS
jgi:hypothetical protein